MEQPRFLAYIWPIWGGSRHPIWLKIEIQVDLDELYMSRPIYMFVRLTKRPKTLAVPFNLHTHSGL